MPKDLKVSFPQSSYDVKFYRSSTRKKKKPLKIFIFVFLSFPFYDFVLFTILNDFIIFTNAVRENSIII